MKRLAVAVLVALSGLVVAQDKSVTHDGNWLLRQCSGFFADNGEAKHRTQYETFNDGLCAGYLAAIADQTNGIPTEFCHGPNVTYGQEEKVVYKFLQDHPESLDLEARHLISIALDKAFPCETRAARK